MVRFAEEKVGGRRIPARVIYEFHDLLVALKIKKHWLTKGKEVNSYIETSPFLEKGMVEQLGQLGKPIVLSSFLLCLCKRLKKLSSRSPAFPTRKDVKNPIP